MDREARKKLVFGLKKKKNRIFKINYECYFCVWYFCLSTHTIMKEIMDCLNFSLVCLSDMGSIRQNKCWQNCIDSNFRINMVFLLFVCIH